MAYLQLSLLYYGNLTVYPELYQMPELGGMSDEQLASPLVANSIQNMRALKRANFIENGQIDLYHLNDRLSRTIGLEFDTGWIDLHLDSD